MIALPDTLPRRDRIARTVTAVFESEMFQCVSGKFEVETL